MGTAVSQNFSAGLLAAVLKGRRLAPIAESGVHFAFAWLAFNPDGEVVRALP